MGDILTKDDIERILPHRAPFNFVDRVDELEAGKRILAARTFGEDEDFFRGHFPGDPIVPGVILVEALAQAFGILAYRTIDATYEDMGVMLLKLDRISFRHFVRPGEEVTLEVIVRHRRDSALRCFVTARVGDRVCVEGDMIAAFVKK